MSKTLTQSALIKIVANTLKNKLMINDQERQVFRGLIGSLQYATVNTRPDLGSRLSFLQSKINNGQIPSWCQGSFQCQVWISVHTQRRCPTRRVLRCIVRFGEDSIVPSGSHDNDCSQRHWSKPQKCCESPIVWSPKKIQKVAVTLCRQNLWPWL